MTQLDETIARRLSSIEARLARIEEILLSEREDQEQNPVATQEQCYKAWVSYLTKTPEAVEAHPTAHELAALKASINAPIPVDS